MWQINYCPSCGARVTYNDKFCGTCGFNLTLVMPQVPPPPYEYQLPYNQWVPSQGPVYDQAAGYANRGARNAAPMSTEIAKLLEDLFEKRVKYNKT